MTTGDAATAAPTPEHAGQDHVAIRQRLRALDACLDALEEANERGETLLSARLAAKLQSNVGGLRVGMATSEAISRVFAEQQAVMRRLDVDQRRSVAHYHGASNQPNRSARYAQKCLDVAKLASRSFDQMTTSEAQTLTQRIKRGLENVSLLLLEAHQRRAWAALGYPTWEAYVRHEFGLSRTRSYELVYHGQVLREIQAASGMSGIPNISPYTAIKIRAHLQAVVEVLKVRLMTAHTEAEAASTVAEVVENFRARGARRPEASVDVDAPCADARFDTQGRTTGDGQHVNQRRLMATILYLASMPPAADVVTYLNVTNHEPWLLARRAAAWLTEFSEAYHEACAAAVAR